MQQIIADFPSKESLLGNGFTNVGTAYVGLTLRPGEGCDVIVRGPDRQIYTLKFIATAYASEMFGAFCLCGQDGIWRLMGYSDEWDLAPVYIDKTALHQLGFAAHSNNDGTWVIAAIPSLSLGSV